MNQCGYVRISVVQGDTPLILSILFFFARAEQHRASSFLYQFVFFHLECNLGFRTTTLIYFNLILWYLHTTQFLEFFTRLLRFLECFNTSKTDKYLYWCPIGYLKLLAIWNSVMSCTVCPIIDITNLCELSIPKSCITCSNIEICHSLTNLVRDLIRPMTSPCSIFVIFTSLNFTPFYFAVIESWHDKALACISFNLHCECSVSTDVVG